MDFFPGFLKKLRKHNLTVLEAFAFRFSSGKAKITYPVDPVNPV
jgi:hypothetical protein